MHNAFLAKAQELKNNNQPYATAYIVRRKIPSSGKPGDKAIITTDGLIHGWIGGGFIRGVVLKEALETIRKNKPRMVVISSDEGAIRNLENTHVYRMPCKSGCEVEVFIEPILPSPNLVIFGTSHIAMALSKIAKAMDYQVDVVMNEPDEHIFPSADSIRALSDIKAQSLSQQSYVVVCTQGERDLESLHVAIQANTRYLAFVSSMRRAKNIFSDLGDHGVTLDQLSKIKIPAGLNIKAKTPEEVAISILAEIIEDYRSEKSGDPPSSEVKDVFSEAYSINPVCNVPIQKSIAKYVLDYKGEKVYFYCDSCKTSFEKNPEKYMVKT